MKTDKWAFVNLKDEQGTRRVLKLQCPKCNQWGYLEDHSVDESGQVIPSVDCPVCDYHEFTQLTGFPNNPYQGKTY